MRRGFEPPKVGEEWAGWPLEANDPRKMTILQVHSPTSYRVSYQTRKYGTVEEETTSTYMIQPWDSYKQAQAERRQRKQVIQDKTQMMELALRTAGMKNPRVLTYSDEGPMYLDLTHNQSKQLLEILRQLDSTKKQPSTLERIFG